MTSHTENVTHLRVIVFPGGFNWPLWMAEESGAFAARGLRVEIVPTTNSVEQMSGLIEGRFDIAMTALDNVVAYNVGAGESGGSGEADLVAVMGADSGFLRLVAAPGIEAVEQFAGRALAVDALTIGYAFVLRELLDRHGLREGDVQFVRAGGVLQRFEGLLAGRFDGTLLVSPFDLMAADKGHRILLDAARALGRYQGVVAGVRRDWAQSHRAALTGFVAAYRHGIALLRENSRRDAAIELLSRRLPQLPAAMAARFYEVAMDPLFGFTPDARLNPEGVDKVLRLREKFSAVRVGDVSRHVDTSFHDAAMGEG